MQDNLKGFAGKDVLFICGPVKPCGGMSRLLEITLSIWKSWRGEIFMMPSYELKISARWKPNPET